MLQLQESMKHIERSTVSTALTSQHSVFAITIAAAAPAGSCEGNFEYVCNVNANPTCQLQVFIITFAQACKMKMIVVSFCLAGGTHVAGWLCGDLQLVISS